MILVLFSLFRSVSLLIRFIFSKTHSSTKKQMETFGKAASTDRRKKKEANRRTIKEGRKNRLREMAA